MLHSSHSAPVRLPPVYLAALRASGERLLRLFRAVHVTGAISARGWYMLLTYGTPTELA